jgi:hypothetical protein
VTLSTNVIHPGGDGQDGLQTEVGFVLSNGVGTVWDGRAESGVYVQDGNYTIQIRVENAENDNIEMTKSVAVLGSRPATGATGVWPNTVLPDQTVVTLHSRDLTSVKRIKGTLYTIAGMKVGSIEGLVGQNDVKWELGPYASGLYIIVLDTMDGTRLMDRTTLKLLVQR